MQIIRKVIVGSRLHGVYNDDSDYDYRGVHLLNIKDLLSPYRKTKTTNWMEGDEDNISYELAHFCKLATQGNMTIHEILWSDKIIAETPLGKELYHQRHNFLDSEKIFAAARGYASSQLVKMNMTAPDQKTNKFIIAYIRVMQQAIEFFNTGKINCKINRNLDFIRDVKWQFTPQHVPQALAIFQELEREIVSAFEQRVIDYKPDIPWIEDFIVRAYT